MSNLQILLLIPLKLNNYNINFKKYSVAVSINARFKHNTYLSFINYTNLIVFINICIHSTFSIGCQKNELFSKLIT